MFPAEDFAPDRPRPTPLFAASAAYSEANLWTSVNGWTIARVYSDAAAEYDAALGGAGVVDATAIARYRVQGPDAGRALNRLTTLAAGRLSVGEAGRGLLCDNAGRVVDLADVARVRPDDYVFSLSRPRETRLRACFAGLDAVVAPLAPKNAALVVVGPQGPKLLKAAGYADGGRTAEAKTVRGVPSIVRPVVFAGGDAMEIVFPADEALVVWERLARAGAGALAPQWVGLDALEALRIENAEPRLGLDFASAEETAADDAPRPAEIGLGRLAPLDGAWFSGRAALRSAPVRLSRRLAALRIEADRAAPGDAVLAAGRPVGRVTSAAWSPRLKSAVVMAEIACGKAEGDGPFSVAASGGEPAAAREMSADDLPKPPAAPVGRKPAPVVAGR